jgi:hypothetical protein
MVVEIHLPEDISAALERRWRDLPRHILETLAIEGYRSRALSRSQVRRLLGFETSLEVDVFMSKAGVPFPYSVADLEHDIETHQRIGTLGPR